MTTRRFTALFMNADRIIADRELVELNLVDTVLNWYRNRWEDHRNINYFGSLPLIKHIKNGVFEMTADADVFLDSTDSACGELIDPDHSCGCPVVINGQMYAITGQFVSDF